MNDKVSLNKLSIVIPFYNEKKRINKSLKILQNYILKNTYRLEIIFVNDGSTDNSEKIIKKKISNFKKK